MKMTYYGVIARILEVLVTLLVLIVLSGLIFQQLIHEMERQQAAVVAGLIGGLVTPFLYRIVIGPFCKGLRGGSKF